MRTAADAVTVLDRVDGLVLLADLYAARRARPDRGRPGTAPAAADLAGYLGKLRAAGYAGDIGIEYVPAGASADSFGRLTV